MTDSEMEITRAATAEVIIPDGTQFVIVDLDNENERVQVEFSLNGRVLRAWLPASRFEKIKPN